MSEIQTQASCFFLSVEQLENGFNQPVSFKVLPFGWLKDSQAVLPFGFAA